MNRTTFEIAYEGPGVEGSMDVKDLAPALLALGNLFELANQEIGRPDVKIQVVVKTGFIKGSFKVTLEVIHGILEQIKTLFDLSASDNLGEFLTEALLFGTGSISLLGLIKKARGRKPKNVTVISNGFVRLEFEGEAGQFDQIEVSENVLRLYRNPHIREEMKKVVAPLEKSDISRLIVSGECNKQKVTDTVEQYDLISFVTPEEVLSDTFVSTQKLLLDVIELAFQKGYKWRFSDGESRFTADLVDEDFLKKVESGLIEFRSGDTLDVELETTQTVTTSGIRTSRRILKVYRHIKRGWQSTLDFG